MPPDDEDDELEVTLDDQQDDGEQQDDEQQGEGQQDDDQQDDDDQQGEGQQDGQPPARTDQQPTGTRRDRRISTLQEDLRRRDTELADVKRRLDELTRQAPQAAQPAAVPQETEQQRAARWALLSPEERMAETLADAERRMASQLGTMQFTLLDTSDKAAFESRAAADPLYRKYLPKVEAKLAELRNHPDPKQRSTAPREVIFKYLLGEAVLEKRSSPDTRRERRAGEQRVARERGKPVNGRSDQRADRGRQTSLERRLENTPL